MALDRIRTDNVCGVGLRAGQVLILFPHAYLTPDEAMLHAAWLVAIAESQTSLRFDDVLTAVKNT